MRFSIVAGEPGAADAERDVRGFAVKFYTEEGDWDLVGNNTPVFFIRDPLKFSDFIHTQERDTHTYLHNPEIYRTEVEQAAFAPANVVPGISFSPDKVLQARLLSYPDAHCYWLSVNAESLPVNRPHVTEAHTYHRDGAMRFDGNGGGSVNYEPSSFGGPVEDVRFKEPPLSISGDADRYDHRLGNDDYTQDGNLYRLLPADKKQRLFRNITAAMQRVPHFIIERQLIAVPTWINYATAPGLRRYNSP